MKLSGFILFTQIFLFVSIHTYSQENSALTDKQNNLFILQEKKPLNIEKKSRMFSFGGGVCLYHNFYYVDAIMNSDLGFQLSKHFAIISGAEFEFRKTSTFDINGNSITEVKLLTTLFSAPSYFIQTKNFVFSTGGGIGLTLPNTLFGLHGFLMFRSGYLITDDTALNFSLRIPVYLQEDIESLSASVMYTFLF